MTEQNFEHVDLSTLDNDFGKAEAQQASGENIPDGTYQVSVDKVQLAKSQGGTPMIKWELRVLGPTHRKRKMFKNSAITVKSLPYLKKDLITAGLNLAKLSDLETRIGELLDVQLEIKRSTKGEYSNVWFKKRIEVEDPDRSAFSEDDIPF